MIRRREKRGQNCYSSLWENDFKWVVSVPGNKYSAKCTICETTFSVESSGRTSVLSHAKVRVNINIM